MYKADWELYCSVLIYFFHEVQLVSRKTAPISPQTVLVFCLFLFFLIDETFSVYSYNYDCISTELPRCQPSDCLCSYIHSA